MILLRLLYTPAEAQGIVLDLVNANYRQGKTSALSRVSNTECYYPPSAQQSCSVAARFLRGQGLI